jgi:galactokinase
MLTAAEDGELDRDALQGRLEHFLEENQRVIPAADNALQRGDLSEFGLAVEASQRAAERLLGNQVPETSYLASTARQLGAAAASAFGAGFGGSVWALVEGKQADGFIATWRDHYLAEFPQNTERCCFFTTGAGPPLFRVA